MRLSDEQIKAFILHEDSVVRKNAIDYFARSLRSDASVMETVIAALEKYGYENANPTPYSLDQLTQSAATIDWCLGQLERVDLDALEPGSALDDYRWSVADAVKAANIELLRQFRDRIDALPRDGFEPLQTAVRERFRLAELDTEALWKELEAFCTESADAFDFYDADTDRAERIAEAISQKREAVERMLDHLEGEIDATEPDAAAWMAGISVRIAGELRLEGAVKSVVGLLDLENEWIADEICRSLALIGSDQAVEACKDYVARNKFQRGDCPSAVTALMRIPTDAALAAVQSLQPLAERQEDREQLALAAVWKFSDEAVRAARELILQLDDGPEYYTLEGPTAAAAECLGIDFPEKAEWLAKAREEELEYAADLANDDDWDDDDLEDDEDWDDDEDLELDPGEWEAAKDAYNFKPIPGGNLQSAQDWERSEIEPIRNVGPKVGRNDPCPCGSGKKFKNCCLGKQTRS